MLFMVIERFKDRDALAVYRRFRERGRMTPDGLTFVESWVEANCERCFQIMECDDCACYSSGPPTGAIWSSSSSCPWCRARRRRKGSRRCSIGPLALREPERVADGHPRKAAVYQGALIMTHRDRAGDPSGQRAGR